MIKKFLAIILATLTCVISVCAFSGCSKNKEFTITFYPDGGTRIGGGELVQTVTSATEIVEPELDKEGFVFIGWNEVLSEINSDTTVKALWEKGKFVVRFIVNGGVKEEGSGDDTQSVLTPDDIKAPVYTRKGYDLVWDTDIKSITESCTVRGNWVAKSYNLKFRTTDDKPIDGIADMVVTFDQPIGQLSLGKIMDDQKIVGWKIRNSEDILTSGQSWTYDSNKTAEPVLADLESYIIEYQLDGGTHTGNPISYREDHESVQINNPTRRGYNFSGWQELDEDGESIGELKQNLIIEKGVTGNKSYRATWTAKTYTVKLVTDYGTFTSGEEVKQKSITVAYDQVVDFPEIVDAPNEFLYWSYSNYQVEDGYKWEIDGETNYTFNAVFQKRYKFVYVMECTVRNNTVTSTLNDPTLSGGFERTEGHALGKLPTYTPMDEEEYSASYWKFKKGSEFVTVNENTLANPATFVGYTDENLDGLIEVELYAWCRPNWTPSY